MLPTFEPAPTVAPHAHHFDFTVTGLSHADAEHLMAFIIEEVEYYAATLGGGFAEVTADGDPLPVETTHDAPRPA